MDLFINNQYSSLFSSNSIRPSTAKRRSIQSLLYPLPVYTDSLCVNACLFLYMKIKGESLFSLFHWVKGCLSRLGKLLPLSISEFVVVWAPFDWLSWSECLPHCWEKKWLFCWLMLRFLTSDVDLFFMHFIYSPACVNEVYVMQPRMTCRKT